MAVIRWEPVAELNAMQNEMNRLFNTFFDHQGGARAEGSSRSWIPAMDLVETGDHYVLHADLPGLSEKDINVQLEDNVLTISGERKLLDSGRQQGYYRLERAYGHFSRSLTLPDGIAPDALQARFEHGVLQITIPKPEQKKPRRVQINVGKASGQLETGLGETAQSDTVETGDLVAGEAAESHSDTREPVTV